MLTSRIDDLRRPIAVWRETDIHLMNMNRSPFLSRLLCVSAGPFVAAQRQEGEASESCLIVEALQRGRRA